jgi:predicted esterase
MLRLTRAYLLFGGLLLAQDAGEVLRTSVAYRTQRNTLQLTDEQKQQADQLARAASQAGANANYSEAMRNYHHAMAVMRAVEWTPGYEFAASLQPKLDHAVVDPGSSLKLTLTPLYKTASAKLDAAMYLVSQPRTGGAQTKLAATTLDSTAAPATIHAALPENVSGDHTIEVRLSTARDAAPLVKSLVIHVEPLAASAANLRARLSKLGKRDHRALPTVEYTLALLDRADHGDVSPAGYKWAQEFARANELLDAIEAGRDPFAAARGDLRKAYRSAADQTLQPYRLMIPSSYNAAKSAPLVVALHGMGGDENSMFDASGYEGSVKREAERAGFVVVCPKGRDPASMYRGTAEQDVLDVLAEVRRDYNIDPARIYLMGHSMGGYGTWSIAMAHPELFAALGPIAGGGNAGGMAKIAQIPHYVVHGDDDRTVPVAQSRTMVEAGKKAGAEIVYMEIPGGSHGSIVAPQIGPMFDFFAKQRRR